jgi:hypothetical protein
MRSFLLQPYPFSNNIIRRLAGCVWIGVFITLFLALFEPFGFDELPSATKWLHAFYFGVVTFVVSAFFQAVLPEVWPNPFREEGWRSWKEIIYLLITTLFIGAGNYGLMLYLYPQQTDFYSFLRAELITLQVGVFPICFIVFTKQMKLYRRYAAVAKEATDDIHPTETEAATRPELVEHEITLRGDNQKETLTLLAGSLFYISSADNYVRVQYQIGGVPKSAMMRSTLKKMEEQLAAHPAFFRCHRMYLVNLQRVISVSGNAQGLKLQLDGLEEAIPVSRNLTETVREKLHFLSHSPQKA